MTKPTYRLSNNLRNLNKAIVLEPTNPKFYYGRGAAYYKQDNYDHAILDCDMTIKTNPDFTEFSYGGGV